MKTKLPKRIAKSMLGACVLLLHIPEARAQNPRVHLTPAAGFQFEWDQNNGRYFNQPVPDNAALATQGAVAFASSEASSFGHTLSKINDGHYGNANSWISANVFGGNLDPEPWIAVRFPGLIAVQRVAWGRDNGNAAEGQFNDRAVGQYAVQITRVPSPNSGTPETGNASTGWRTVGTANYLAGTENQVFAAFLRHEFSVSEGGAPALATAVRIKLSDGANCIDELEVNPPAVEASLEILPATGFEIDWDGNNGLHSDSATGAAPPSNVALASRGAVPISSSQLALGPVHYAHDINDGLYGNTNAWISANGLGQTSDANPWVGVSLPSLTPVRKIAWGRDNGDDAEGIFKDRTPGIYTVQFTRVPGPGASTAETGNADTGWQSIGTVQFHPGLETDGYAPYLRHEFAVSSQGEPISATGIRLKVSDGTIAIDELEIISNSPPNANAGPDQNLSTSANCTATVSLDGSESSDPDGDLLTYQWSIGQTVIGTAALLNTVLPPGIHTLTLTVNDGNEGIAHDQVTVSVAAGTPALAALTPATALANSPALTLHLYGACFGPGGKVNWNGVLYDTVLVNDSELTATIPAAEFATFADLLLVNISVVNPSGGISASQVFVITNPSMGELQSGLALAGDSISVSTAPMAAGAAGLVAVANNTGGEPLLIAGGTYEGTPPSGLVFGSGGIYYDLVVFGANADDAAAVSFYYPSTVMGAAENQLRLTWFNGTTWKPVKGSGNSSPEKDTTDNQHNTISGGRFTVTLDNTSSPMLTELSGTVFALANTEPLVTVTGSVAPMAVNTAATVAISYDAIGTPDTQTILVSWGDGSQSLALPAEFGETSATHTYTTAGVYTVVVTETDANGDSGIAEFRYVVVYDPSAGFVTGGGWINSPVGACMADPNLSGKANFGFVAKYKNGANIPEGNTAFQFKAGNLNFKSTAYEWLVVSGARAQYKGSGTINGQGSYDFKLTAIDGQAQGGGGSDRLRMKIWDRASGGLIYDNQLNASDDAALPDSTIIGGGSIVLHKQ